MDQYTLGLGPLPKKTRKEVFLDEMNQVVPWATLVAVIAPFARGSHQALGGRPPFPIETMLRIHCLQLWWNQWHFGMKAHIGVDADSGLVHTVIGTAANVNDVTQAAGLLHGKDKHAWGDAGYQGVDKRQEMQGSKANAKIKWHVAMRPGKRKTLDANRELHKLLEKVERLKASVRAKVEHPFRVIKQQFGYAKVRYRGLEKNTARLTMLFALGNLWMARKRIMALQG